MTARVLVVDDVDANVKLLEARLTAEYFEVRTARSGPEALHICARDGSQQGRGGRGLAAPKARALGPSANHLSRIRGLSGLAEAMSRLDVAGEGLSLRVCNA
jgi:CheY-like chemotaxis protein